MSRDSAAAAAAAAPDAADAAAADSGGRGSPSDAGTRPSGTAGRAAADGGGDGSSTAPEDPNAGDDAGPGDDDPMLPNSQHIAEQLASAVCGALLDCLGPQKLQAFVGRERCETRIGGALAQDDLGSLAESVKLGRVRVDESAFDACYRDTRGLGCAVQTQRLPDSCQEALQGTVAEGGTCSIQSDCGGSAFCSTGECPRTCSARHAPDGPCARDEECESGLICIESKCRAPAAAGDACAGKSGGVCRLGTSCVGSDQDKAGTCRNNSEVQAGELGAACTPGGTLCKEGLACGYDGGSGFSCQNGAALDEACHLALPGMCPADAYCDARDVTSEGTCRALPGDSEECALGDECAAGMICLLDQARDKAVCRRLGDLGDACSEDATCRSGECAGGTCRVRAVCE
jgi:hypothetical protein